MPEESKKGWKGKTKLNYQHVILRCNTFGRTFSQATARAFCLEKRWWQKDRFPIIIIIMKELKNISATLREGGKRCYVEMILKSQ